MGASVADFMEAELTSERVQEVLDTGDLDLDAVAEKYLWDGRTFMRRNASMVIRLTGHMAAEKTNLLAVAAKDADAIVRENSLGAIAKVDIDPSLALAPLLKGLGDPEEAVRTVARDTLDRIADRFGDEIIPHLIDALTDPRSFVRMVVVELLLRFQELSAPLLVAALTHGQQEVVAEAYRTLQRLGLRAAQAEIDALPDKGRRRRVADLLMQLPELPEEQIEAIKALTESDDAELAAVAGEVLNELKTAKAPPEKPQPIEADGFYEAALADEAMAELAASEVSQISLRYALTDTRAPARVNAALALGLRAEGKPDEERAGLAFSLAALVRDDAVEVRLAAVQALTRLAHPEALSALLVAVQDGEAAVSEAARQGLAAYAASQAKALLAKLSPDQPGICHGAILDALVAAGKGAVGDLQEALTSSANPLARELAAASLERIGKDASGAVDAIVGGLSDGIEAVRRASAAALAFVGEPTEPVLAALKRAMRDGDLSVRIAASTAKARLTGTYEPPTAAVESEPIEIAGFEERELTAEEIGEAAVEIGVERLAKALDDGRGIVRHNAATALASVGADAIRAKDALCLAVKDADPRVRKAAATALGALGPKAVESTVPALVVALADSSPLVVEAVRGALDTLGKDALPGLVAALDTSYEVAQRTAVPALVAHGKGAVKPLAKALESESPRARANAARALGNIGADAAESAEALAKLLEDPADEVRGAGALALGALRVDKAPILEALKAGRKDRVGAVRQAVAFAYDQITGALDEPPPLEPIAIDGFEEKELTAKDVGKAAGDIGVDRLVAALKDGRPIVRHNAAVALSTLKAKADGAADALCVTAKDADPRVRKASAEALGAIGKAAADRSVPVLVSVMADLNAEVAETARAALDGLGKDALDALMGTLDTYYDLARRTVLPVLVGHGKAAVKPLTGALESLSPRVRANAATTLGLIGADGAAAAEALAALLQDPADSVRRAAAGALGSLGVDKEPVLEAVKAARRDAVAAVRRAASLTYDRLTGALEEPEVLEPIEVDGFEDKLLTAKELKGDAKGIGPERLAKALRDGRPVVRHNAAVALGTLGAKAEEAATSLALLARDPDPSVREAVCTALGELTADVADVTVPALCRALANSSDTVREAALGALTALGADALPALTAQLDADPERVAKTVLPAIVAQGKAAVKPLADCLEHLSVRVRSNAVKGLGMLGPDLADDTRELVEKALTDADEGVRKAAKEALDAVNGVGPGPAFLEEKELPEALISEALTLKDAKAAGKGVGPAVLKEAIFDGRENVRQNVARAIAGLGKQAAEVLDELLLTLKDGDAMVRAAAAEALGDLKIDPERAGPAIAAALRGAHKLQQEVMLEALGSYGKAIVEPIVSQIEQHLFTVLPAIGPVARHMPDEFVDPVAKRLSPEHNAVVRENAAEILIMMGRGAAKAEKALVAAVEERDGLLRFKFIQAMGRCCKINKKLFDLLDEIARTDDRPTIHDAIREAKMYMGQP